MGGKIMKNSILLVDDEESIINSLIRLFRNEDYEIFTATSGKKGLEIMENNEISLVISDHKMPEMSGVEFLALSREISPGTIRIMLTGYADLQASIDAINKGEVYRFITKPWNDEELKMTVKQSLDYRNLIQANRSLTKTIKKQAGIFNKLEESHPGITEVARLEGGAIIVGEDDYDDLSFEKFAFAY
jgi:DNA-binding NtrC family response regulator